MNIAALRRFPSKGFQSCGTHLKNCVRLRQTFRTVDPDLVIKDRPQSYKPTKTDPLTEAVPIWEDPWRYAFGEPSALPKYTSVVESQAEWSAVERLMPAKSIPEPPHHDSYPTPSGWVPPKKPDRSCPFFVRRDKFHLFPLKLQTRRDLLDPKTLEYDYVELVTLHNIEGDIFACANDVQQYVKERVGHDVALNIVELHGKVHVKGADRSVLEAYLLHRGF